MKIVLIELPHIYLMQQRTQAPLGLMYLASVLEKNGFNVDIVRLINLNLYDTENFIPDADIYGISSVSLDYSSAKIVAEWIHEKKVGKIIIGGYHATCETKAVMNEKFKDGQKMWDSVCCGESEGIVLDIVRDVESGNIRSNYRSNVYQNLNDIPFPARNLVKDQGGFIFSYDKHYSKNRLSTVISSSRGCPYNCGFCATRCMWGGTVRFRSADNIIKEIRHCIKEYGIREFRFSDELFTVNKKRTKNISNWLASEDIYWKCSTRSDCVDKETLSIMKRGGCKEIAFGVESADPEVLKAINKNNKVIESVNALKVCDELGINTRVLMMINTPGETVHTVDKNIEFLESVPYTCTSLSVFKPLPGSPVWNDPEKFGIEIISRDLDKYNIYMWMRGTLDENNSEDIFIISTLPFVKYQIENRRRMIDYFYKNGKMNEIDKAIKQKKYLLDKKG